MISSRRVFLGTSLAAAMPLSLDWQRPSGERNDARERGPVADHVARQLAAVHERVTRTRVGRGEDIRIVAANLRLIVADTPSLDAQVASAIEAINTRGQDAFFAEPLPPAAAATLRRELRRYGVTNRLPDLQGLSPQFRHKTLAALATQGGARVLLASAAQLETVSAAFDGAQEGVVRVQMTGSACCDLWWNIFVLAAVAAAVSIGCPLCGVELTLAALVLSALYEMNCGRTAPCY